MDLNRALNRELTLCSRNFSIQKGPKIADMVIMALGANDLTVDEVVGNLGLSPMALNEPLSKLKQRLFVKETDNLLSLTPKGQAAFKLLKNRKEEDVYRALSDEEKEELIILLKKLNEDWQQNKR